jgi:hypothetical protein
VGGRADQSPVSYARNNKLTVSAKFAVTTAACRAGESVQVRGKVAFGAVSVELTGSAMVNPGDKEASGTLTSDKAFADEVGIFESSDILGSQSLRRTRPAGVTVEQSIQQSVVFVPCFPSRKRRPMRHHRLHAIP